MTTTFIVSSTKNYSDYDLSVREQLWMKGTVPGREPSRLPIFGETENIRQPANLLLKSPFQMRVGHPSIHGR